MKLDKLLDDETGYIFCRGHDKGCPRKGAARDLDSKGCIDIYCAKWIEEHSGVVSVIDAFHITQEPHTIGINN
jgi:hypothetical protein